MVKRAARASVLGLVLLAATAGTALGHECFVVNRSEQGTAGAAHSKVWAPLTLAQLFATAHQVFGGAQLSGPQVAWAVEQATTQGVPSSFAIFVGKKTIGQASAAFTEGGKASDGTGVDWFFTTYGQTLANIFFAARAQ
jgi:hypothetical protein